MNRDAGMTGRGGRFEGRGAGIPRGVERQAIVAALSKHARNVTRAARTLGVSRATLQNGMKLYGLRRPGPGSSRPRAPT